MNLRAILLVAVCAVLPASSAPALAADGDVRVTFANGRVTIVATDATVAEILQEWARVGGSRFINAEKISSRERLTLRLENEPEMRAIDVLLRSAAGYVAAPRIAGATGASSIGNVVIQASTRAGTFTQAVPGPAQIPAPDDDIPVAPQFVGGQVRPDDDGPTRQQVPPPAPAPVPQQGVQNPMQSGAPLGQASPLQGTQTQTVPGLGAVTSTKPGAVIPNAPPSRQTGRPSITPSQPRPGGGG